MRRGLLVGIPRYRQTELSDLYKEDKYKRLHKILGIALGY